ncbi:MAG: PilZ domain-containing protein [Phycisphaerales bacterium]
MTTATMDRRIAERFRLEPAVVFVVVGAHGNTPETKGHFEGHAYDISDSGIRVELDAALPVGTPVEVSMQFPGCGAPIQLVGKVARLFDEVDDPGPRRMGIHVRAATAADESRLTRLLDQAALGRLI